MPKTYFIYRYIRNDINVPFYIGMGTKKEMNGNGYRNYKFERIYERAFSKDRNKVCLGIMNKVPYDVEIIYETNDISHAYDKEKEFIDLYGIVYDNSGTLVNLTMGGISFKPTDELLKQNKKSCEKAGRVFRNVKRLYMFDYDGNLIESFDKLKGFYDKYKIGQSEGQGISASIRNKKSCLGYLFSFSEKINPSEYKINNSSHPIVIFDINRNVLRVVQSIKEASRFFKSKEKTISLRIKDQKALNGCYLMQTKIHEINNIISQ